MFEYISLNTLSKVTVSATFWWFITKIHTLDREVQLKSILGHIQDLQREIGKNKRQQIFTEIYKWKSWYIFFIGNFSEYLASRNFSMSSVWNLISFARKIPRKIHLSFFFLKFWHVLNLHVTRPSKFLQTGGYKPATHTNLDRHIKE